MQPLKCASPASVTAGQPFRTSSVRPVQSLKWASPASVTPVLFRLMCTRPLQSLRWASPASVTAVPPRLTRASALESLKWASPASVTCLLSPRLAAVSANRSFGRSAAALSMASWPLTDTAPPSDRTNSAAVRSGSAPATAGFAFSGPTWASVLPSFPVTVTVAPSGTSILVSVPSLFLMKMTTPATAIATRAASPATNRPTECAFVSPG